MSTSGGTSSKMDVEACGVRVSSGGRNDRQEIPNETLEESLYKKLNGLPPPFSYECCIYSVPNKLRRVNEEAYSPRLVSIGPLHHGSPHLQAMEHYKVRCLKSYLEKAAGKLELKHVTNWAENIEIKVRMCYQDPIKFTRKELAEMLLLDGVFIVELFLNYRFPEIKQLRDEIDLILGTKWMMCELLHDLMLLENQLPFRVPLELLNFIDFCTPVGTYFDDIVHEFFKYVGNTNNVEPLIEKPPKHLLDYLLRIHLGRELHRGYENKYRKRGITVEYPCTATVLQEAGVKFRMRIRSCIFDIVFKAGVLTIPRITVNEWTESFFRNLIAFEQCDHRPGYVSSYIIFMDSLVNTAKDVDILIECGIISNSLGDSEQVADLFNNLYKEVLTEDSHFYYAKISKELNDYSKDYWHQLKATRYKWVSILRRDYFSNPWSIISLIAAIVLLILTIVQTVCSVLQVKA